MLYTIQYNVREKILRNIYNLLIIENLVIFSRHQLLQ